jgi:hypothetical protein
MAAHRPWFGPSGFVEGASKQGSVRRWLSALGGCGAARLTAVVSSGGRGPQQPQGVERCRERVGPWPSGREPQDRAPGAVDEPTRHRNESGAHGPGNGELVTDAHTAEMGGPADQVVGEHRAFAATPSWRGSSPTERVRARRLL